MTAKPIDIGSLFVEKQSESNDFEVGTPPTSLEFRTGQTENLGTRSQPTPPSIPPQSVAESIWNLITQSNGYYKAPHLTSLHQDAVKQFLEEFDEYSKNLPGHQPLVACINPEIVQYICQYELQETCVETLSDVVLLGFLSRYKEETYKTAQQCMDRLEKVDFDYSLKGGDRIRSLFISLERAIMDMGLSHTTANGNNLIFSEVEQVEVLMEKLPAELKVMMIKRLKFLPKPLQKVPFMKALLEESKNFDWDEISSDVKRCSTKRSTRKETLDSARKESISQVKRRAEKRIAELLQEL